MHRINLTRTIDLGHKMKKRVMALLAHNMTRWVGLSAEAERQGHPRSRQSDTMIVTKVDIVGMLVPLTQKRRFRALAGLIARQKIPLHLPEIKELSNDEKWDLFDKHVQKHLKFQEDEKLQAFKLFWKTAAKAWRQFRYQLR
jgi:aromatic ring hydroxylase